SVKTATEIVSENSKTYQTKQVNEELIEEGLRRFIHTLAEVIELYDIDSVPDEYDIEFFWDDTIVKDKYTDSDFFIKLKDGDLITAKYALMKILDFTEEQAEEMMEQVAAEKRSVNPDINELLLEREIGRLDGEAVTESEEGNNNG
ncbi:MAG TPA: phage portal protein, partial [Bacteroidales bacterium]|nr:phage portal protein [Bacteroidales bacterium]